MKLSSFPAFHRVSGRGVLVVGGGGLAAARLRLLAETDAEVRLIAPKADDAVRALVAQMGCAWLERPFRFSDARGQALIFAAADDDITDRLVASAARAAGVPVNVSDRPELCDFDVPAVVNRAPVSIAIGTAGAAPVLAQRLRAAIEAILPDNLGSLATIAAGMRGRAARLLPGGDARRRFWRWFFDGPAAATILAGDEAGGARIAERGLVSDQRPAGHVWLVGAGPGAADLMTLRACRVLQDADVILHDALVSESVLALGRREAERIPVGKRCGRHSASQDAINTLLVTHARAGRRVVRLKAGDPLIFGRAGEEMAALRAAGIGFDVVPGVTSALAAAAEARLPLTLRGIATSLVFASAHDLNGETLPGWVDLALSGTTIALYMGRAAAETAASRLMATGLDPATPVAAVENATHPTRRLFAGTLRELGGLAGRDDLDGPVLILIGRALGDGQLAGAERLSTDEPAIAA